ncbi:MAG: DegV family protein [Clostridia bacterium]|nr:DegV family protein [Clostridia bacterium]
MRKIKIVSDSSSDILALEGGEFASAPLKIITAEEEFVDDATLDVDTMVNFFDKYKGRSKTSCPNATDWLHAFGDADDVICVTITSALSGSYNAACVAKQIYESEHEGRRVFVLDTLSAGPEIGLVLEKLAEYVRGDMSYEDICENIQQYLKKTGLVFMLKSMKNLANNGRVSPLIAKIAGFVGICVVGKASDQGTLEAGRKCHGEVRALETLVRNLEQLGLETGKVKVSHCLNESGALRLKEMLQARHEHMEIEIQKCRGLCSFYAEKGGILVGFEKM